MPNLYDVIVVGAGPAGSTAAFFLGQAGKRVLVLEKEVVPRYKPCGGGLSAGLLAQFPFSFESVIESRVKTFSYAFGDQTVTVPVADDAIFMVMRDQFDAHILAHARADVRQASPVRRVTEAEDRVIVETRAGETFEGRYLIGADGASSVVARDVGLRRGKLLAAAVEAEVPVPPDVQRRFTDAVLFVFGEVETGYLWIFPKAQHLSVGIGSLRPKGQSLQETLARVMARYGISLEGARLHGHPLPIYNRREPIATRRTLLVGDAAGLIDPLTGEGIRYAVDSGRMAAEAILAGQTERYPALIHRRIGRSHALGLKMAHIFYNHPRGSFKWGVRNPLATYAFVDLLSGKTTYPRVIMRIFGTLPIFLTVEAISNLVGRLAGPERQRRFRAALYRLPAS